MKTNHLQILGLILIVSTSCTVLPKMAISTNGSYLSQTDREAAISQKVTGTDFACKRNFFWSTEGLVGFDGLFYDDLIKTYSIGEPKFLKMDPSSNTISVTELTESERNALATEIGSKGSMVIDNDNVGADILRTVGGAIVDMVAKNGYNTVHQVNYSGELYNYDHSHKIQFTGFNVEKEGTAYTGSHHAYVQKMVIKIKSENAPKEYELHLNPAPSFAYDLEHLSVYLDLSPDGKYLKIGNLILNLIDQSKTKIWDYAVPFYEKNISMQEAAYSEGIHSFISPDWTRLGFVFVDYYLEQGVLGNEVKKACKTADLHFYKLDYIGK